MNHINTTSASESLHTIKHDTHVQTWIEINRHAFEHNIMQYKRVVGSVSFAPVIKSNAYGHGLALIGYLCQINEHVDRICVVSLQEAVYLRRQAVTKPIIVLGILDHDLEMVAQHDIAVTIYDEATAHALHCIGKQYQKKISVHIKVDTGLSRLGALPMHIYQLVETVSRLSHLHIEGIFTHLANSESCDPTFTEKQLSEFEQIVHTIAQAGIVIKMIHASCSAAITAYKRSHYTLTRAGVGIYGLWPSPENQAITVHNYPSFHLQSVLTWKTTIIHIKQVPAGTYVGYDLTHQVQKDTRIATLPVGYWDGYNRAMSNNGHVLINNHLAPVIGRIAMNLMMVDVTNIPACLGDHVVLLGSQSGVQANDLALRCNTINYEIVTRINAVLPRILL